MAAADITLLALAMVTTTVRTSSNGQAHQPLEVPTEGYSAVTDLGDDRGLSATLRVAWDTTRPRGVLDISLETSADQATWRELAAFKRVEASAQAVANLAFPEAKQSISAAADRYVRVKYRVAPSYQDSGFATHCGVTFGVAARRT